MYTRRFLLEDFLLNGASATPHYHCSDLSELRKKYSLENDFIVSKILEEACREAKKDEWRVSDKCGTCSVCTCCKH